MCMYGGLLLPHRGVCYNPTSTEEWPMYGDSLLYGIVHEATLPLVSTMDRGLAVQLDSSGYTDPMSLNTCIADMYILCRAAICISVSYVKW